MSYPTANITQRAHIFVTVPDVHHSRCISQLQLAAIPHTYVHVLIHSVFVGGFLQLYSDIAMCPTISAHYDSVLAAARVGCQNAAW